MKPERLLALIADGALILGTGGAMLLQLWTHRADGAVDGGLMTILATILTTRLGVGVWLLRPGTGGGTDTSQQASMPSSQPSPSVSPSLPPSSTP